MKRIFLILFLIPQSIGNLVTTGVVSTPKERAISQINKEKVTLTIYRPTLSQTDSTPNITASGFKIDTLNPNKHKIIAVSRDLKNNGWSFGKKVRIKKAGKYNGVYTIRDVMNKRHKKRIDVLVGDDHDPIKLSEVEITLLN